MQQSVKVGTWLKSGALAGLAVLGILGLVFGGLLLWLTILDPFGGAPHPSDAKLLAQFKEKRAVLEQLVEMIKLDPDLKRLAPDFTRPENSVEAGVSADRIALYRKLCREAGILKGFQHYGGAIQFIVHTRGLSIAGSGKGFTYREGADPYATIIDGDLDAAIGALPDKSVLLQRRIDGNWWLELDMR